MNGWRRMSLFWLRHPTWAWDALAIKSEISSLGKWINSHNSGGRSLQSPLPIFHHWAANLTPSSYVGRCSSVFGCLLSCPVEHPGHRLLCPLPPKPVLIFKPQVLLEAERNKSLKASVACCMNDTVFLLTRILQSHLRKPPSCYLIQPSIFHTWNFLYSSGFS